MRTGEATLRLFENPKTLSLHRFESSPLANHGAYASDRRCRRRRRRQVYVSPRASRDEVKESLTADREDALVEDETALKEVMLRE